MTLPPGESQYRIENTEAQRSQRKSDAGAMRIGLTNHVATMYTATCKED
jgi:hypothetical protein